jgi:hypothetical protein
MLGEPIDLSRNGFESHLDRIIRCLEKPKRDRDNEITLRGYVSTKFLIPKRNFIRDGVILTKTNMLRISRSFEKEIKYRCRLYISSANIVFGTPINVAIKDFQEKWNLTEDVFSYDLIYKDYQRNGRNFDEKNTEIRDQFQRNREKILTEMSESRQFVK